MWQCVLFAIELASVLEKKRVSFTYHKRKEVSPELCPKTRKLRIMAICSTERLHRLDGFSLGSPISTHSPKTCTLGRL